MKRILRILLWTTIVVIVLIAIGAGAIALFFPKEKAKNLALEKLSTSLNREVKVDDVEISVWGGLGVYLKGIKIANPGGFTWEQFMEARALDVKLKLWPLIKGDIRVDRTILINPRIGLFKTREGQVNYIFGVIDSLTPEPMKDKLSDESKMAATAISFENLSIVDGYIDYADDSTQTGITIHGLDMNSRLRNPSINVFAFTGNAEIDSVRIYSGETELPTLFVNLDYNATADLNENRAIVKDSRITINGIDMQIEAGIPNVETFDFVNIEIESDGSDLGEILKLVPDEYREQMKAYNLKGKLSMKALAKYNAKKETEPLSYEGWLDFNDLVLSHREAEGTASFPHVRVEFTSRDFNANIENVEVELQFLEPMLDTTGQADLAGTLNLNMNISSLIDNLYNFKMSGNLSLANGSYNSPDLPETIEKIEMEIGFSSEAMEIRSFALNTASSDLSLSGTLNDPFPGMIPGYEGQFTKPSLTFELTSNRFNYDRMFPDTSEGGEKQTGSSPTDSIPISVPLPDINAKGTGKFGTFVYSEIEITNVETGIIVEDRVLRLENIEGDVYSGGVKGEFALDLQNLTQPEYRGNYRLNQIEINDFLTKFTGLDNRVFGKVNMEGSFDAEGWEPEPIINSLTMDGDAILEEGKLVNLELLEKFAERLDLKMPDEETIRDLSTKFKVENGRVSMDDFTFLSKYGNWTVGGSVGFDGSLDYRGSLLLTEEYSRKLIDQYGAQGLFNKGQRLDIPIVIGGTYKNPNFSVDFQKAIKNNINVEDKAKDFINNLFGN